ncbi:MAG: hypothetical protein ACYC0X_32915 [Pirellulaceae bacterium]
MMLASFRIVSGFTPVELVLGVGETEQKKRMEKEIGNKLIPHNGFLYLVLVNGVTGLALFVWFVFGLWRISSSGVGAYTVLSKACLLAYLLMTFVQSHDLVYAYIFLMIAFGIVVSSGKRHDRVSKYRRKGKSASRPPLMQWPAQVSACSVDGVRSAC